MTTPLAKKLFMPQLPLEFELPEILNSVMEHYSAISLKPTYCKIPDLSFRKSLMGYTDILKSFPVYIYNDDDLKKKYPNSFTDGSYIFLNSDEIIKLLHKSNTGGLDNVGSAIINAIPVALNSHNLGGVGFSTSGIIDYINTVFKNSGLEYPYGTNGMLMRELNPSLVIDYVAPAEFIKELSKLGFHNSINLIYPFGTKVASEYSKYYIYNTSLMTDVYKLSPSNIDSGFIKPIDSIVDKLLVAVKNLNHALAQEIIDDSFNGKNLNFSNMGAIISEKIFNTLTNELILNMREQIKIINTGSEIVDSLEIFYDKINEFVEATLFFEKYFEINKGQEIGTFAKFLLGEVFNIKDDNMGDICIKTMNGVMINYKEKRAINKLINNIVGNSWIDGEHSVLANILSDMDNLTEIHNSSSAMPRVIVKQSFEACLKEIETILQNPKVKLDFVDYIQNYVNHRVNYDETVPDARQKFDYIIEHKLYDLSKLPGSDRDDVETRIFAIQEEEILRNDLLSIKSPTHKTAQSPKRIRL